MSKKIPAEDTFKVAGVGEQELKKAATIYNENMTALKKLRRKSEALIAARVNEAIANKRDVSQAVEAELSTIVDEERRLNKELSNASMRYRHLLDKLKNRDIPLQVRFPTPPLPPLPLQPVMGQLEVARRVLCPPRSVDPIHLLAYGGPVSYGLAVTAPSAGEIEASESPPEIHIYISGGDPESSCIAFGDIKWGFDIPDDQICKLEIGAWLQVGGANAYFPEIDGPTNYNVVLEGNIIIFQYRGHCMSLTELNTATTPYYNIWRAHPPSSFGAGNPDETVTEPDSPGFIAINPHGSEIFEEIYDVKPGDSFVFYYYYGVSVHHGVVNCGHPNDDGHLVIYPPHAVEYVFRMPRRIIETHRHPWG